MSAFRDRPFNERFNAMGDRAEQVFERVSPKPFVRFGLNRPPLHLPSLPARIRHMPDYLCSNSLVEVMGVGRDGVVKLKREKADCLAYWNTLHPVALFLWDSHRKRHTTVSLQDFMALIDAGKAELGVFPEGKAYFALSTQHFEWQDGKEAA